jgi:uncharacterized protein (DUF433 family)
MSPLTQRPFTEIESAPEPVQRTPGVCGGEACIGRTRIAVWMLEDARRLGVSNAELLQDYPSLTDSDLAAAWAYVAAHPAEIDEAIRTDHEAWWPGCP